MPMNYNPDWKAEGGGRAEPGTYQFKVDDAEEKTFNSGNDGCKLTLMVGALPDRDIHVFENLMYVEQSAWRIREFLESVGCSYERPPDARDLINKTGTAKFKLGKNGYLEVETFLPASASNGPDTRTSRGGYGNPPPPTDDDMPPF